VTRTLYYANGSIPSWRVLLALRWKQLAFVGARLRLMGAVRETRLPEFLMINPRGMTPVLIDEGCTITESFAILQYIERVYPRRPLLPEDPAGVGRALARAYEAETFACAYEPIELMFNKSAEFGAGERARIAGALAAVGFELELWERRAGEAGFIAGEEFSLADVAFYPTLAYMLRRGLSLAEHPRLAAYRRRVEVLPAAVASHPVGWAVGEVGKADLFARARALARG
jgi:glutathione S-transferase